MKSTNLLINRTAWKEQWVLTPSNLNLNTQPELDQHWGFSHSIQFQTKIKT